MRIPTAVYRVQFSPAFGFKAAREIVAYLSELGISEIYASPVFRAKSGSMHGYDIVDPGRLNPELGTVEEFEVLQEELRSRRMGWLQDIVPNHMAYDGDNRMLMDVLENGECSRYLPFFDIDWSHPYEGIRGRVLAPFLGRPYGQSLEDGEITLRYDQQGFSINYYELSLPLKMESYTTVVTHRLDILKERLGEDHPDFIKFLGILYSLKNLPSSPEASAARYSQVRFIKRMLWELYTGNGDVRRFIDENITLINGRRGEPESFNMLDHILSEQLYRLSFWKVATEEINYRRFFNINGLISLRMEDEEVFEQTHSFIFRLVDEGRFTGLRIDHIDGLYDPTDYLERLRERVGDCYLVVEKILEPGEELPSFWPVQGTTGYDFLNHLNGLFCDGRQGRRMNRIYYTFTGIRASYEAILYEKKKLIIEKDMAGDVDNLAHLLKGISGKYRHGSDITLYGLKRAIVELLAFFPVYRTYISEGVFRETDRSYIRDAVTRAKELNPGLLHELNFIEQFLLLEFSDSLSEEERQEWVYFVMRFQQLTGPLMAKGFEDTTLYVYNRLISLNEVGGSPDRFGTTVREFHEFNIARAGHWPHSLNTTSTHDTKRGEDVRARINVLSEIPGLWEANLKKWSKLNRKRRRSVRGVPVPDRNDEYLLYQTLIGAFPFDEDGYGAFVQRVKDYAVKAVREAKVHTAWLKPDVGYEEAFVSFVEEILSPSGENPFLEEFLPFQRMVAYYGMFNSLGQTLVKITSPGVPDFYQGTELWDLNLVDPDNRRPVDFGRRKRLLREIVEREGDVLGLIRELLSTMEDGRIKLFLIYRALHVRRRHDGLFRKGGYIPCEVRGRYRDHILSFARVQGGCWALTAVPRLLTSLIAPGEYPHGEELWDDTHILLPPGAPSRWRNEITAEGLAADGRLPAAQVLKDFPVALLTGSVLNTGRSSRT